MLTKYKLTGTHILNRSSLYYRISTGEIIMCDNHKSIEDNSKEEASLKDASMMKMTVLSERLISMAKDEVRNSMMRLRDIKSM